MRTAYRLLPLAGCCVLAIVLSPPLHELSDRYFSVHMIEHELLMAVAAPLIVLGRPLPMLLWGLPQPARRRLVGWTAAAPMRRAWRIATGPMLAWSVHTLALWIWHVPLLFETALHDETVHALQHVTFLGAALLYWSSLIANRHDGVGYGTAVLSLFATAMQCGLLGALLTLASVAWYPDYPAIEDQQLAGLVMWVPAGIVYTGAGIAFLVAWLKESERRTRRWERAARR
jgi:putative membrane protein